MYQLYYDKEKFIIEIKPLKAHFKNIPITDEVKVYNQCYYFCNKRKLLKEFALKIKQEWANELLDRLNLVNNIVIK
jgi:hypothetical protein